MSDAQLPERQMSRSDLQDVERAVKQGWVIPQAAFSELPEKLWEIVKKGKPREVLRAANILRMLNDANAPHLPAVHLHATPPPPPPAAPEVTHDDDNGPGVAGSGEPSERIQRLRAILSEYQRAAGVGAIVVEPPAAAAGQPETGAGTSDGAQAVGESREGGEAPGSPAGNRRNTRRGRPRKTRGV